MSIITDMIETLEERPTESIFRQQGYRLFSEWWKQNISPTQPVPSMAKELGRGRVAMVWKVGDLAVKIPRDINQTHEVAIEKGIYDQLAGVPHFVRCRGAVDRHFVVLDLVNGDPPSLYLAQKEAGEPNLQDRATIIKQMAETLTAAMKKGIYLIDTDLTSNVLMAEKKGSSTRETTFLDPGDAISTREIVELLEARIARDEKRHTELLQRETHEYTPAKTIQKNKAKIISLLATATEPQQLKSILETVKDETLRKEFLALITNTEALASAKKTGPGLLARMGNLLLGATDFSGSTQAQASYQQYETSSSLKKMITELNDASESHTQHQQDKGTFLEAITTLKAATTDLKTNPDQAAKVVSSLIKFITTHEVFNTDSDLRTQLLVKYQERITKFSSDIAEMIMELLVKNFNQNFTGDFVAYFDQHCTSISPDLKSKLIQAFKKEISDPKETLEIVARIGATISVGTARTPVVEREIPSQRFDLIAPKEEPQARRLQRRDAVVNRYFDLFTTLPKEGADRKIAIKKLATEVFTLVAAHAPTNNATANYLALTSGGFVHQGEEVALKFSRELSKEPADETKLLTVTQNLVGFTQGFFERSYLTNFTLEESNKLRAA